MSTKRTLLERFLANRKRHSKEIEETLTLKKKKKKQNAYNKLYHESYLKYVFITTGDSHTPTPLCLDCCYQLSHAALKPSKLFCYLNNKHPGLKDKPFEYFETKKKKKREHEEQKKFLRASKSINENALKASYLVAKRIAKAKKPFTIGEELILPSIKDLCRELLGGVAVKKIE